MRSKQSPSPRWKLIAWLLLAAHLAQPLAWLRPWVERLDVGQEDCRISCQILERMFNGPRWCLDIEEIAGELAANKMRLREIEPLLARGETGLAWAGLRKLWDAYETLAVHNARIEEAWAPRKRILRARLGLPPDFCRQIDEDSHLRTMFESHEEAWRRKDWKGATDHAENYYKSVRVYFYATSQVALAKWMQADPLAEHERLLEVEKTLTSEVRDQRAAFAALSRELDVARREVAALRARLNSAEASLKQADQDAQTKGRELVAKEAVVSEVTDLRTRLNSSLKKLSDTETLLEDARSKGQDLLIRENQLRALCTEVADLRARLTSPPKEAIRANRSRLVDYLYNCGKEWAELKNYHKAIVYFDEVIRLQPERADAHNDLGTANYAVGNYNKAISCHRKAIELRPDDPEYPYAYICLSGILSSCPRREFRNVSEAIRLAEKACGLTRWERPEILRLLATAYQEAGYSSEAARRRVEEMRRTARDPFGLGVRQINPNGYNPFIRK